MNAVGQGVKLIGWRGQLLKSAKVGRGHASRSDAKWSKSSDKMKRREGGGRRRTNLLLAFLVIWPLTTHPFRDGAAVLLLMETPPTFGRSQRCSHTLHEESAYLVSPSCFVFRGHHLFP